MGMFLSSVEFFPCALNVAVIGYGGYLIMKGQLDYRDLITFSLYIATFVLPMRKISNFFELFANGFAGLNRFVDIMRTEPTVKDAPQAEELGVRGDIQVKNVSFSYGRDEEVLSDVSLHVLPGETVAVVGPSGGGKTTLCQLIPRFYDVTAGAVYIDGRDVRKVTQSSLHRAIGIVQQGCIPCGHDNGKHTLRQAGSDGRRGDRGGQKSRDIRGYCRHASRLCHICRGAGHAAFRRAEAAGGNCEDIS